MDRTIGHVYFQGHTRGEVMSAVPDMSGFIFRFAVFSQVGLMEKLRKAKPFGGVISIGYTLRKYWRYVGGRTTTGVEKCLFLEPFK